MYVFEIFTPNLSFYVVASNLKEAIDLGESVFYRAFGKKANYLEELYRCERLNRIEAIGAGQKGGK